MNSYYSGRLFIIIDPRKSNSWYDADTSTLHLSPSRPYVLVDNESYNELKDVRIMSYYLNQKEDFVLKTKSIDLQFKVFLDNYIVSVKRADDCDFHTTTNFNRTVTFVHDIIFDYNPYEKIVWLPLGTKKYDTEILISKYDLFEFISYIFLYNQLTHLTKVK